MFSSPVLGKGYILGSPDQHWDMFYRFPSPLLGKGSVGFPVQYWKRFCKSPSPILGKLRFKFSHSAVLGKYSRFPSAVLETVLGSKIQNLEKVL